MKSRKWYLGIALIFLINGSAFADRKIASASSAVQAGLGVGWDSKRELFRGECVQGTPAARGLGQSTLDFKQTISYSQLEKELGFGAGGRARIGVVEVSASAKFLKSSKSDAFSISAIYQGDYQFKNSILEDRKPSERMGQMLNQDDRWDEACGDEYVQQVTLGAKIFFSIRIDFASEAEKKSFEANFGISGPLFSASASLKTAMSEFSKRSKVTVSALQIGGNVDQISHIFGSPANMVKCSVGQFDLCSEVLTSALDYATNQFPEQIKVETHDKKENTGPVVLSYLTAPYVTAGIFPKHSAVLREEVKRARRKLDDWIKSAHAMWVFADRYLQDGSRRLSARQANLISKAKRDIDGNVEKIVDAAEACYNDLEVCMDRTVELEVGKENGLAAIDKAVFVIENESFAQFCDDGVSPFPNASPALKESVRGMIDAAKELSSDAFLPRYAGQEVDACYVASTVFARANALNLKSRKISDIRPLMEFVQLESMDLSDNKITDLEAFGLEFVERAGGFKRLRNLKLTKNQIEDLAPLAKIPRLENLDLSYNVIRKADVLTELKHIRRVDLRNNSQDLECRLPASVVCLTADHGSSGGFAEISRRESQVPRIGLEGLKLESGNVLLTGGTFGGADTSGAELFTAGDAKFERVAGMRDARMWHSMTRLQNGKILILGGFGQTSGELFDPKTSRFRPLRGEMNVARSGHTATLLADGRVLVVGGWQLNGFQAPTPSIEIFDPRTEFFKVLANGMSLPRAVHTANVLSDGRVLIAGGITDSGSTNSVDIFDPRTMTMQILDRRMQVSRGWHTATPIAGGKILFAGGVDKEVALDSAEIFDPGQMQFHLLNSRLVQKRYGHRAVTLSNGLVAFVGGTQSAESFRSDGACKGCVESAEVFDPSNQDFSFLKETMVVPRAFHSMTEIGKNKFLIVGGMGRQASTTAEYFSYSSPNQNGGNNRE